MYWNKLTEKKKLFYIFDSNLFQNRGSIYWQQKKVIIKYKNNK